MTSLEGLFSLLGGVVLIGVIMLCHMITVGQFRRNSREVQYSLATASSSFLQATIEPRMVVPCDQGPYPIIAFASMLFDGMLKSRAIIVNGPVVFLISRKPGEAAIIGIVARGCRGDLHSVKLGGLYGKVQFGQERLWIERKYFAAVRELASEMP